MPDWALGGRSILIEPEGIRPDELVAVARGGAVPALTARAHAAIAAGFETLCRLVQAEVPIYGVTRGLGAAVSEHLALATPERQAAIPLARATGTGREAGRDEVRAMLTARLCGLAHGHSGCSPALAQAYEALLRTAVHPVVPMTGSLGAGDLAPSAHLALPLLGVGEAWYGAERLPGDEAMRRAGIDPPALGPKDGLVMVSSNAASTGCGCLVAHDTGEVLEAALAAASLSLEAYRAALAPLDPETLALRPLPGHGWVSQRMAAWLEGSWLWQPRAARRLQDPLSLRCILPVYGAAESARSETMALIETELRSSTDNPAVLTNTDSINPNAHFDTTALALAFERQAAALARVAALTTARIVQHLRPQSSDLPRFLANRPEEAGYAPILKTATALTAEIQRGAFPQPPVLLATADGVEDYASCAPAAIESVREILPRLRRLVAIELLVASRALDLRGEVEIAPPLRRLHGQVRQRVAPLERDRPAAPDINAVLEMIESGEVWLA